MLLTISKIKQNLGMKIITRELWKLSVCSVISWKSVFVKRVRQV